MRFLFLAAVVAAAAPAVADDTAWRFACDGTAPFLAAIADLPDLLMAHTPGYH